MGEAQVVDLPVGRVMFLDEQGRGLRATWHLDRGFVNLSVWHDDHCSETFRLTVGDTARLVGFLVDGLSDATAGLLRAVSEPQVPSRSRLPVQRAEFASVVRSARRRLASWIAP